MTNPDSRRGPKNPTSARHHATMRWARRLLLVLGGAAVVVVLLFWYFIDRPWSNLREAADDLVLPPDAEVLRRTEIGTMFCFITCGGEGEAQIQIEIGTGPQDPCSYLRPTIQELAGEDNVSEPPLGFSDSCLYAELPRVRSDAYLIGRPCPDPGGCLSLTFSSGVE